jgi:hypothetical protein
MYNLAIQPFPSARPFFWGYPSIPATSPKTSCGGLCYTVRIKERLATGGGWHYSV